MRHYFDGARTRLRYLKGQHGANWRTFVPFNVNPDTLGEGANGGQTVWYSSHPVFRNERFASDILSRMGHTGWFGDTENQEKLIRGIVASLPHGRFLAGYYQDDNEERVYFPGLHTDESDAARMADEHARIAAEQEDEYSQRFNEAMRLNSLLEAKESDLRDAHEKLRMAIAAASLCTKQGNYVRWAKARAAQATALEWARSIIADIRAFRQERAALKVD